MKSAIELAKQAGMVVIDDEYSLKPFLERFAALVRAQALDEAAVVCEEVKRQAEQDAGGYKAQEDYYAIGAANDCAAAIRALKEKT